MSSIIIGGTAPDFSSIDQNGKEIHLNSFKDKYIVLYFYPRDNTPGCSIEAKKFRDLHDEFVKSNAVIIGVSVDSIQKHKSFAEDKKLPFSLISDSSFEISKNYGTYSESGIGSFKLSMSKRDTFLIKNGKIINIWKDVSVLTHAKEVLDKIILLSKS